MKILGVESLRPENSTEWESADCISSYPDSQGMNCMGDKPNRKSMIAYSTSITSYNPSMQPGELSIPVSDVSAEYVNEQMIIFGVLGPLGNQTSFNHVW
ncbi:hypothetical protein GOBAR_AA38071 [Gossypium barbadense]|uniref:AIR12 DOMON domain-containing protein n=1 Tax=Gossypium barbadense TaxID=3634 RepID=A0A2P5VUW9_GOSBA|nr:hypothetical protein GOBAR_AA38071 [Gossypium barbadense]